MVLLEILGTTVEIIDFFTAISGIFIGAGVGYYAYKNRGQKDLKQNVEKIATNLPIIEKTIAETRGEVYEVKNNIKKMDNHNSEDHQKIFQHIDSTAVAVKEILTKSDIEKAIDNILINAQGFVHNQEKLSAFFELCAVVVKQMAYELAQNGLDNLTVEEVQAKVQFARFRIREFYDQFEDDFMDMVLPKLTELIDGYQNDLLEIKKDVINDKNLRVKITSTMLLQHTYSYMVEECIKYRAMKDEQDRKITNC